VLQPARGVGEGIVWGRRSLARAAVAYAGACGQGMVLHATAAATGRQPASATLFTPTLTSAANTPAQPSSASSSPASPRPSHGQRSRRHHRPAPRHARQREAKDVGTWRAEGWSTGIGWRGRMPHETIGASLQRYHAAHAAHKESSKVAGTNQQRQCDACPVEQ